MVLGVCAVVETGNTSTRLAPAAVTTALPVPRSTATPSGMGSVVKVVGTPSLTMPTMETLLVPALAATARPACGYIATPWGLVPTPSSGFVPKPVATANGVLADSLTIETGVQPAVLEPG